MTPNDQYDAWNAGQGYEHYMGRWSRMLAAEFLAWLDPPTQADWLEVGCGTGALTAAILQSCAPRSVRAIDPSAEFVAHTRDAIADPRVRFVCTTADALPLADDTADIVTSALALNFLPDKALALAEMSRVLRPGGLLAFYVWDYPSGGLAFVDRFWKAAVEIDGAAAALDESARFAECTREGLEQICRSAGFADPKLSTLRIVTEFADFEAYWTPFTHGAGPAPSYCMGLPTDHRQRLKDLLATSFEGTTALHLNAEAHGVIACKSP